MPVKSPSEGTPRADLAHRVTLARERLGETQGHLAELFDLRRATISDYERGAAEIPVGYLSLLAGWFEDYWSVFRWLLNDGLMPRLEPWAVNTVRTREGPSLGADSFAGLRGLAPAWREIATEMRNYERRGEAAPSAQLAHWLDRLTSAGGGDAASAGDALEQLDREDQGDTPPHGRRAGGH